MIQTACTMRDISEIILSPTVQRVITDFFGREKPSVSATNVILIIRKCACDLCSSFPLRQGSDATFLSGKADGSGSKIHIRIGFVLHKELP